MKASQRSPKQPDSSKSLSKPRKASSSGMSSKKGNEKPKTTKPNKVSDPDSLPLELLKQASKEEQRVAELKERSTESKKRTRPENLQGPKPKPAKRQKTTAITTDSTGLFTLVPLTGDGAAEGLKGAATWLHTHFYKPERKRVPAYHALYRDVGQPAPIFLASAIHAKKDTRKMEIEQNKIERTGASRKQRNLKEQIKRESKRVEDRTPEDIEKLLGPGILEQVSGIGGIRKGAVSRAGIDDRRGEGGWSGLGEEDNLKKSRKKGDPKPKKRKPAPVQRGSYKQGEVRRGGKGGKRGDNGKSRGERRNGSKPRH